MTAPENYAHGSMDVSEQTRTFNGFMRVTVWSSALTSVAVLYLTLIFAAGTPAFGALAIAVIAALAAGLGLRLSLAWYATVAVLTVAAIAMTGFVVLLRTAMG